MHLSPIEQNFPINCKRSGVHLLSFCAFRFLWSDWGFACIWRLLSNKVDKAEALSGCLGPEDDCGALLCVLVFDTPIGWAVLSPRVARTKEGWFLETVRWDLYLVGPVGNQHEGENQWSCLILKDLITHLCSLVVFNKITFAPNGFHCHTFLKCMWIAYPVILWRSDHLKPQ